MDLRPHPPQPDSMAGQIVDLVARNGQMTVGQLVEELGVTITAVRHQVNKLLADGWLVRSVQRGRRGRPSHVLSMSDQGKQLFGRQFDEFSSSLLEEILEAQGPAAAKRLLRGVSRRMAEKLLEAVGAGSPAERAQHLAQVMGERGIMVEIGEDGNNPTLYTHTCPYHELASEHREVCRMEEQMFSQLVGAEVTLGECMLDGHQCCEFKVGTGSDDRGP